MKTDYLQDIKVKHALRKEICLIYEDEDINNLNELMLLKKQEEVLVVNGKKGLEGIITRNDLAKFLAKGIDRKTEVKNIMTKDIVTLSPEIPLLEAKVRMRLLDISRVPILDEKGELMGIITAQSICDAFSSQLKKAVDFQELVLDQVKSAICIIDDQGEILSYNKAFEELFRPSRVIKPGLNQFLPATLAQKLRHGERPLQDIYFESKDRRRFTLRNSFFHIDDDLKGTVLIIEEISGVIDLLSELDKTSYKLSYLEKQLDNLKEQESSFGVLESKNPDTIKAIDRAKKISSAKAPVVLIGECGAGKGTFAGAIHDNGERRAHPMIKVSCGTIPAELLETEVFGSEEVKPTSTGGSGRHGKIGLIELADKGTIFFEELEELPIEIQTKLLDFLRHSAFVRVGGNEPVKADVRIMAASAKSLPVLVEEGKLSKDLYYGVRAVTIDIPPLRERSEDIIPLANRFIREYQDQYGKKVDHVDTLVLKTFLDYPWPGNVRELKNVVERMVLLSEDGDILEDHLPKYMKEKDSPSVSFAHFDDLEKASDVAEKQVIAETLKRCSFNKTKTAEALSISRSTLYNKMRQYGLDL